MQTLTNALLKPYIKNLPELYALYKWKFIWLLNTLLRVQQGEQPLGRGLADMRNDLYDWDYSCNAMQWSGKRNDILTHVTGDSVMQISIIVMFMYVAKDFGIIIIRVL